MKDTVDEDVEHRSKASLPRMASVGAAEEIHDEENDDYDDDFEVRDACMMILRYFEVRDDYDDDFEVRVRLYFCLTNSIMCAQSGTCTCTTATVSHM